MASSQVEVEERESGIQLKRLGFLRTLTVNVVVLVSNIYDYAKQNSGSLKPSLENAESAVAAAVSPIYQRFKGVPAHLLVFLDTKVDEATQKFEECAPPTAKKMVCNVQLLMKKASSTFEELAEEAKVGGPIAAVSRATTISKNFTVNQLAVIWYKINQNPTLHGVSKAAIPTAAHWSEKYNNLIKGLRAKGCTVFCYAPLVPIEEMTKAYKRVELAGAGKEEEEEEEEEATTSSGSESDEE